MVTRTNRPPPGSPEALRGAILIAVLAAATCGCLGRTVRGPDAEGPPPEECNGQDDDGDGLIDEIPCPERYVCTIPQCSCAPTHTVCQGWFCYAHFNNYPEHCGACGHACAQGMDCVQGRCVCNGFMCGGACVQSSDSNCGTCGNRCAAGMSCVQGRCQCTARMCNGVCTPFSDPANCGACGRACPAGAVCMYPGVSADVACQCLRPSLPCGPDRACVRFDDNNCGGCGYRCPDGTHCQGGSCG